MSESLVSTGSGNGLLHDGTNPSPAPTLTYRQAYPLVSPGISGDFHCHALKVSDERSQYEYILIMSLCPLKQYFGKNHNHTLQESRLPRILFSHILQYCELWKPLFFRLWCMWLHMYICLYDVGTFKTANSTTTNYTYQPVVFWERVCIPFQ